MIAKRVKRLALFYATLILSANNANAQFSNAVFEDKDVDIQGNKYLKREAFVDRRDPVRR